MVLTKEIKSEQDLERWEKSIAYAVIIDFLNRCNEYTRSKSNSIIDFETSIHDMNVIFAIHHLL